ncbi:MAG TPA: hypothetical protein VN239_00095 [Nitrososphaera sp.]|nr:hypothetical protein [Nitrososphaera sp.]
MNCTGKKQNGISAIVSRDSRLNQAGQYLEQVHAHSFPTIGRNPLHLNSMNQEAFERLKKARGLTQ